MTDRGPLLLPLPPHLPLVGRIVRLVDGELGERGLPEMFRQARCLQINLAARDLACQRAVELGERALRTQQLRKSRGFGCVTLIFHRQLPCDETKDVDGYT